LKSRKPKNGKAVMCIASLGIDAYFCKFISVQRLLDALCTPFCGSSADCLYSLTTTPRQVRHSSLTTHSSSSVYLRIKSPNTHNHIQLIQRNGPYHRCGSFLEHNLAGIASLCWLHQRYFAELMRVNS
jgi:hypothetical protein